MNFIQLNSRGNDVVCLKQLLSKWGYQTDGTDVFDSTTDQIVRNFQRDNGLTADGKVGNGTWNVLQNESARNAHLATLKAQEQAAGMETVRKGSTGLGVFRLQQYLSRWGYDVKNDGVFGDKTDSIIRLFQERLFLAIDGVVGNACWRLLFDDGARQESLACGSPMRARLCEGDYKRCAGYLNVEPAAIKAVKTVETGSKGGFLPSGKVTILFEGHTFWSELKKRNIDPQKYVKGNEDVLYSSWDKSKYKSGEAEYARLEKAKAIHEEAALCSASWGVCQIMGFNYSSCGCSSVKEFIERMHHGEAAQLRLFAEFLKSQKIVDALRRHDWATVARKYNGPGYKDNDYDTKLRKEYDNNNK